MTVNARVHPNNNAETMFLILACFKHVDVFCFLSVFDCAANTNDGKCVSRCTYRKRI